jgi:hypothetical protein
MGEFLLACSIAGVLTLFDLDRTFYVPNSTKQKRTLYLWWFGFVLANSALAVSMLLVLRGVPPFKDMNSAQRGFVFGIGYLAIIRAKVTTLTFQGKDVPFGPEALYEAAKQYVYKRINLIAMAARYEETITLGQQSTLTQLATRATLSIRQNQVLSDDQRRQASAWILSVLQDPKADETEKKLLIADFILSGKSQAV